MDSRAWYVFADKVLDMLAADRAGIYADLRPEIERRLFEADPDKELRKELNRDESSRTLTDPAGRDGAEQSQEHIEAVALPERVAESDLSPVQPHRGT